MSNRPDPDPTKPFTLRARTGPGLDWESAEHWRRSLDKAFSQNPPPSEPQPRGEGKAASGR